MKTLRATKVAVDGSLSVGFTSDTLDNQRMMFWHSGSGQILQRCGKALGEPNQRYSQYKRLPFGSGYVQIQGQHKDKHCRQCVYLRIRLFFD